ncbi:hypothetical protein D3C71_1694160 [compost metagenome]
MRISDDISWKDSIAPPKAIRADSSRNPMRHSSAAPSVRRRSCTRHSSSMGAKANSSSGRIRVGVISSRLSLWSVASTLRSMSASR